MKYIKLSFLFLFLSVLTFSLSAKKKHKSTSAPSKTELTYEKMPQFMTFFYEGLRLKEEKKYDEALETFRMCERIDSVDGGLQSELGQLYASLNMKDEALTATRKAYNSDPKNWWYAVNMVALYAAVQQPDKALETVRQLEKYYPFKEEVYQMESALYKQLKQFDKAIQALDKLESLAGVDGSISMEKFNLYLQLKQNKKAIAEIDKLSAKFPTDMRYKVLRGDIYMYQKMPEKAFEIYKHVEATEPQNPYVYVSLSQYYKEKGENAAAMENIMKALKLDDLEVEQKISILGDFVKDLVQDSVRLNETESLFKLLVDRYPLEEKVYDYYAVFLHFRNRLPEAMSMYETMLNINPKNPQTWLQMIQLNIQTEKYEEIKKVAERGITELPEMHQLYFYKGLAESQLKNYTAALEANYKALALVKEDEKQVQSDYYAQIGDINYRMDSTELSFKAYEKALELNPTNIYVMNNYAYYLSEKKQDLKRAESLSAKTVEKDPKNSTYLDTYAWIFYQQGNYSLAKFYIERALDNLDKRQNPGVILDHYGDILLKNGNGKKALEMWQKSYDAEASDVIKQKMEKLKNEK